MADKSMTPLVAQVREDAEVQRLLAVQPRDDIQSFLRWENDCATALIRATLRVAAQRVRERAELETYGWTTAADYLDALVSE